MREERPRRLGDRIVRRQPRSDTERVQVQSERARRKPRSPALLLVGGFLALIVLGTLLLLLPFASVQPGITNPLVALFTATSATCVTGLVVVTTADHWTPFGHVVILTLIQLGGLGFMVGATVLFILAGRRISLQERLVLRESVGGASLAGIDKLAIRVVILALSIEAIGIVVLFLRFLAYFEPAEALWQATFMTISAFNNAGFDITPNGSSLIPYHGDALVMLPIGMLVVLGAVGYAAMRDVYIVRRFRGLTLDTKLVITVGIGLAVVGGIGIFVTELQNPLGMAQLPLWEGVMDSLFLSIASRTAGFTPLDVGVMRDYTLFLLIALMFIGGASGSTAGGIKVNTLGVLLMTIIGVMRGRERTEAFGREIPSDQVRRALTIGAVGIIWVHVTVFVLSIVERQDFAAILFEAVSAFGITGLSTGITPDLHTVSRIVLIITMFVGRLGPMTMVLALAQRQQPARYRRAQERVKIG